MYDLGLIGNCQVSALINDRGSIEWLCLPRPDSDPVFGRLLDSQGGFFEITAADGETVRSRQRYVENTNILVTELKTPSGSFRITDFCPRFEQHGRMFRPMSIFRIVEPLDGYPVIRVACEPVDGWRKKTAQAVRGNSHVRYETCGDFLRVVTNMPLTYFCEQSAFLLKEKLYFGLTWSTGIEDDLVQVSEYFLKKTIDYWRTWVKHCSIPTIFQKETIRSALTLKLHCFEDTGAILAALTTSLPEQPGHERNWDYRLCWLRDSYFVLTAFHNLGHFEEMEHFIKFLLEIAYSHASAERKFAPVYTLSRELPLPELNYSEWSGYENSKPVRSGNQAGEHIQNDVYGEMVLTLTPMYLDERFYYLRSVDHEGLLKWLGDACAKSIRQADAGLWEIRNLWQEHTFSNLMAWAGLERLMRIQRAGYLSDYQTDLKAALKAAEAAVQGAIFEGVLCNGPKDSSLDSSLALINLLHFPDKKLALETINAIRKNLCVAHDDCFFYRYRRSDDFGKPASAFVACSFWIAQALGHLGLKEEGLKVLHGATRSANRLGLYAEHYDPMQQKQLGNFPQAYSHVGLINAAFALSPPWSSLL